MVSHKVDEVIKATETTTFRLEDYGKTLKKDGVWLALHRFFDSPCFRRLSILQEYVLAQCISMRYGDTTIPTSKLFESMKYLSLYGTGPLDSFVGAFDKLEEWHFGGTIEVGWWATRVL